MMQGRHTDHRGARVQQSRFKHTFPEPSAGVTLRNLRGSERWGIILPLSSLCVLRGLRWPGLLNAFQCGEDALSHVPFLIPFSLVFISTVVSPDTLALQPVRGQAVFLTPFLAHVKHIASHFASHLSLATWNVTRL